jgi:hypothetical protein
MKFRNRRPGPAVSSTFAVLVAATVPLCPLQTVLAADKASTESPSVVLHHPADVLPVRMALSSAAYKLSKPACQQILEDFQDGDGRPLRENLVSIGMDPAEYLVWLDYRDGADLESKRCESRGAAAVTRPRDRVVYVCGSNFRAQTPGIRANTLIHEMLHTLGLRENPPSSGEINSQVRTRCGS